MGDQVKAANYIQQLNDARCNGDWDDVPELVRKVRKHAPQRTCLTTTAEAEHAVTLWARIRPGTARPSTASTVINTSLSNTPDLSQYIPKIREAIELERTHVEDDFQAQVCLGWIHWQLGELALAVSRLPSNIEQDFAQLDGTNKESAEWTKVCALKASYIKGTSQNRTGAISQAIETYKSSMPILLSVSTSARHGTELRTWTELFLTGFCTLSSHAIKTKMTSILESETLSAFRAWASFWDAQTPIPTGGRAAQSHVSRRQIWNEYYLTLSDLLQQDLPFPTTSLITAYTQTSTRLQQRAELKRVEARYEALLLGEVEFPKADDASEEVETFVEVVMQNWRVLCGESWHETDLGEGGSEAVSKSVLDILYRAATKTFHSTAVLRHLFTVHLAVAEFDLAFKAFDTYLDIVKKGKARVEKTGEVEHGLDDDETVLATASECIKALCRYGSRRGAEKAKDLGHFFEEWLDKHHPIEGTNVNGHRLENGIFSNAKGLDITPQTFALAWRSIGIAYAQWARSTYDASSRTDLQLKAINCFRKSLLPKFESTTNVETLYALGVILAERRELPAAIEVVKSGLLPRQAANTYGGSAPRHGRFARERLLIPLWHLLALLLSARQEFLTAARSCEGAFEQFQDPRNLFGEGDIGGSYRSEHLNEKASSQTQGVVDDMDDFEKESVLEVKMTQLSLIEVLEGPEVAVNASDELLSLYARLFGDPEKNLGKDPLPTALAVPPQSSAGTIRSIKGSIFGRSGISRSLRKSNTSSGAPESPTVMRPQTNHTLASTTAPTIQVTGENGTSTRPRTRSHGDGHHEKLQKRNVSISRDKSSSVRNRSRSTGGMRSTSIANGSQLTDGPLREQRINSGNDFSQSKPLPPVSQQMIHSEVSLKVAHTNQASHDTRMPHLPYHYSMNPVTRFPKDQERRRRTSILIKVWLLISGFYRRALMTDDAKGAIEEAQKLVHGIETDIAKDHSGNVSVDHAGWAGGKSVGELWGDVYSERGHLAVAIETPYIAQAHFESALTHYTNHPAAIIGISSILLDIYTEDLLPPSSIPKLVIPYPLTTPSASTTNASIASSVTTNPPSRSTQGKLSSSVPFLPHGPLGLPSAKAAHDLGAKSNPNIVATPDVSASYKKSSTALLDRLAARDRAYGLLTALTKLGPGWNCSEAWFVLARAYEEGGQPDKAREVLWWCVELEEGRGVRDWSVVGAGGYVL